MATAERLWWTAVIFWVLSVVFWRPEPPVSYVQVPSVVPYPQGHRIFYEMVKKQATTVSRSLRKVTSLDEKTNVLAVLTPSEGIPQLHVQAMIDWVSQTGGILLVGFPLFDEKGNFIETLFDADNEWGLPRWQRGEDRLVELRTAPGSAAFVRKVPSFYEKIAGSFEMKDSDKVTGTLLVSDKGEKVIVTTPVGAGRIVQIADSRILNNESIGFKKSHLLAAALLDHIGRKKVWQFDESHEGVSVQPQIAPLIGTSRYRLLFLYSLLLLLFAYWWRSARMGAPQRDKGSKKVTEATTLARDIGDFYFRSGHSSWALSRYVSYFRVFLASRAIAPNERRAGEKILKEAEAALLQGGEDAQAHAQLISKMAGLQRSMTEEQKE